MGSDSRLQNEKSKRRLTLHAVQKSSSLRGGGAPDDACLAAIKERKVMRPPEGMSGNGALVKSTGPWTLVSKISEKSSSVNSGVGTIGNIPTLWPTVYSQPRFLCGARRYSKERIQRTNIRN